MIEKYQESSFSHFDEAGQARMVDIGGKSTSRREARASGRITMSPTSYRLVRQGEMAKGDVLGVARLGGIMAAKKTAELIPLAHPLAINRATVEFLFDDSRQAIEIQATVAVDGRTGVEMEALTAVSVAALTIYDMCKSVDKEMVISDIRLLFKSGGKSGTFARSAVREADDQNGQATR